jgi:YhcH/YjgK/YiaL family protein
LTVSKISCYILRFIRLYLETANLAAFSFGKHILDSNTFILRDSYLTKSLSDCFFEGHQIYADIHLVLSGKETFGYCPKHREGIRIVSPYGPEKDLETYEITDFDHVELTPGMFSIVFPDDLHLAKLIKGSPVQVEKAIIKFRL